jgi:hypothetical protein
MRCDGAFTLTLGLAVRRFVSGLLRARSITPLISSGVPSSLTVVPSGKLICAFAIFSYS